MGRREWFHKNQYRTEAVRCEDQDLLLRTYEKSRFAAVPQIVLGYREEELSLRKNLVARRSFVWSALREAFQKRNYWIGFSALIEHTLKGLTECVAVGTGLDYRILRHRALPVDEAAKRRWMEVWEEVQAEQQGARRLEASA
jgi:hypothetical protein